MKQATVTRLKNELSRYLRYVKAGESVIVFERGIPVAELRAVSSRPMVADARVNRLVAEGVVRRGDAKQLKGFRAPRGRAHSGVLTALLDERKSGR
ncbi:MAG: hypothetical protein HY696_01610 [Deltaproteobacteria bacterium]|nr:hypothetical protein [Deltaproteobacteria bacterium]